VRVPDDLCASLDRESLRPVLALVLGLVLEGEVVVVEDDLAAEEAG